MPKTISILLAIIISSNFLLAQNKFLPGVVVTNTNDTLKGSILFKDWASSPKYISFKNQQGEESIKDAHDVKSFTISELNLHYESHFAKINYVSLVPISDISFLYSKIDTSYFFFKVLISSSKMNLYSYSDSSQNDRYFIKKDNAFNELVNYTFYRKSAENKVYEFKNQQYRKQLEDLCRDATQLKATLPAYEEGHLKRYLTKYNACFMENNNIDFNSKKEYLHFRLGLNYGIDQSYSPLNFHNVGVSAMLNLKKSHHNNFVKLQFENLYLTEGETNFQEAIVAFGRYFGGKKIQPYVSASTNLFFYQNYDFFANKYYRELVTFYSLNAGVAFKKNIHLEISRIITLHGKGGAPGPQFTLIVMPVFFGK